jgi:hypothetical protein
MMIGIIILQCKPNSFSNKINTSYVENRENILNTILIYAFIRIPRLISIIFCVQAVSFGE